MIQTILTCHMVAFFLGFLLDLIVGDPYWLPHPIRWIGTGISQLDKKLRSSEQSERQQFQHGLLMVTLMLAATLVLSGTIILIAYLVNPYAGIVVETIMTYQILATKCLKVESMKVYRCLESNDLNASRKAVSMIVGRDTQNLTDIGVAKAAIETVAENTSDGVIAPMLYTAVLGPVFGFLYKTVNTMDSMVGYKNDKYLYFGREAAKLDDFCNYLPARISAYFMIIVCFFMGKQYDGKHAYLIYKRDRYQHASPNSAQTEAACAGALSIQLAGDASYFGKIVAKPYIGDAVRTVEYEDIKRANHLLYATAFFSEFVCLILMGIILWI